MTGVAGGRLAFHRIPYVLDGDDAADMAARSAQIDLEEADTLDPSDPMVEYLKGSAARWRQQAAEIRQAQHQAFHVDSQLPMPSPLCTRCNPTGQGVVEREVPDL